MYNSKIGEMELQNNKLRSNVYLLLENSKPIMQSDQQFGILLVESKVSISHLVYLVENLITPDVKAIIAADFSDDLLLKCEKYPLWAIQLESAQIEVLVEQAQKYQRYQLTIDPKRKEVYDAKGNFFRAKQFRT